MGEGGHRAICNDGPKDNKGVSGENRRDGFPGSPGPPSGAFLPAIMGDDGIQVHLGSRGKDVGREILLINSTFVW